MPDAQINGRGDSIQSLIRQHAYAGDQPIQRDGADLEGVRRRRLGQPTGWVWIERDDPGPPLSPLAPRRLARRFRPASGARAFNPSRLPPDPPRDPGDHP